MAIEANLEEADEAMIEGLADRKKGEGRGWSVYLTCVKVPRLSQDTS